MTRLLSYLIFLLLALSFSAGAQNQQGLSGEHLSPHGNIAIGLLLPDNSHMEVAKAAELAIQEANAEGGYKHHKFELVIRTAEGFWGAGSKESVSLVYEDRVRAIIGALDGRNGHLAEQVATKSHLTYIETFATEPTLSQAFVPWFMRVVPNDDQQAEVILKQIMREGGGRIGILSIDTYDTRYALRSLTKAAGRVSGMAPLLFNLDTNNIQLDKVLEQLISSELDHLVVPFYAPFLEVLINGLTEKTPDLKIYGTLHFAMGAESRDLSWENYEGVYMPVNLFDKKLYDTLPDSHSAYLYDAVNLVISAILHVGTERETITDYISASTYSSGATGTISFDDLGNRQGVPNLIRIKNGAPRLLNHP